MHLNQVRLGPPTSPLNRPLIGDLVLGQSLPRTDMHLTEAVIDPWRQSDQVGQWCRRSQRTPQRARHDHPDVVYGEDPRHRLRIAQRRRLDALVKPTHHPFLRIPRGTPMTHQMNHLHCSSMARPTGRSVGAARRVNPQISGDSAGTTAADPRCGSTGWRCARLTQPVHGTAASCR